MVSDDEADAAKAVKKQTQDLEGTVASIHKIQGWLEKEKASLLGMIKAWINKKGPLLVAD
jgi:hypothetical protein